MISRKYVILASMVFIVGASAALGLGRDEAASDILDPETSVKRSIAAREVVDLGLLGDAVDASPPSEMLCCNGTAPCFPVARLGDCAEDGDPSPTQEEVAAATAAAQAKESEYLSSLPAYTVESCEVVDLTGQNDFWLNTVAICQATKSPCDDHLTPDRLTLYWPVASTDRPYRIVRPESGRNYKVKFGEEFSVGKPMVADAVEVEACNE